MERTLIIAVIIMSLGMSLIPLGDTFGKAIMGFGTAPIFVAFARMAVGAVLLVPFTGTHGAVALMGDWRVWLRAGLQVATITSILTALQTEPLGNAFGAFFAGPFVSYLLSAWLLGEKITWPRTILVIIGFCGVLLVVKPGFAMTPGLAFAAMGGVFYGAFLTSSRWLSGIARSQDLMLVQLILSSIIMAPVALMHLPDALPTTLVWLFIGSGAASMIGNLLIIHAYRQAAASILAPFIYVQLISAVVLGLVIFGEFPDTLSIAGITLIIASGCATLFFSRTKTPTP